MKKISQKEAVFKAVYDSLGSLYSHKKSMRGYFQYDKDHIPIKSEGHHRLCRAVGDLIYMIKSGATELPKGQHAQSPERLHAYARNIIFNWLKKDSRLNGGKKYIPKQDARKKYELILSCLQDQQVKEMVILLNSLSSNRNSSQFRLVKTTLFTRFEEIEDSEDRFKEAA